MYFATIDRAELASALSAFKGLVRRSFAPIVECVLFDCRSGVIEILGTDLDRWLSRAVPADGKGSGIFAIQYERLARFVLSVESADISLEWKDDKATFRARRSRAEMPTLKPEDFPRPVRLDKKPDFAVTKTELGRVWSFCGDAIDPGDRRSYLCGLYLDRFEGVTYAVASDGRSLASTPIAFVRGNIEEQGPIIPPELFSLARNACPNDDIEVAYTKERIELLWDGGFIGSKLPEGDFPVEHWRRLLPRPQRYARCLREELLGIAERARLTAEADTLGIVLNGSLRTRAYKGAAEPDIDEEIDCELTSFASPYSTGVSPKRLENALRALDGPDLEIGIGANDELHLFGSKANDRRIVFNMRPRFLPEPRA